MSARTTAAKAAPVEKPESSSIARRRISKACNYCRQRKIKCNGSTPCLNCQNHSIDCVYSKTVKKVKKKQKSKNLSLQDLEKRIEKIDSKFEYLNDTMNKVLALLQKKNMTLERKQTSGKSRMTSQISSESYDDAVNDYDDDKFSETSDIESANNESNEDDDDEDEQGEFFEEYDERDESQQLPYQSQQPQQPQQLKRRQQMTYPISPVESTDSSTGNDQQNVIIPPIVATNNPSSTNDNFSFGNNISQFEMSMNTLESSIDNKLNFLYGEMPSIANQLEGSLY